MSKRSVGYLRLEPRKKSNRIRANFEREPVINPDGDLLCAAEVDPATDREASITMTVLSEISPKFVRDNKGVAQSDVAFKFQESVQAWATPVARFIGMNEDARGKRRTNAQLQLPVLVSPFSENAKCLVGSVADSFGIFVTSAFSDK